MLKPSLENVYTIIKPKGDILPLVFDSPHSGQHYPDDFNYACDYDTLRRAEDNDVDSLFDTAPDYGATFITAEFPRTYIDVNRSPDDIDEQLLDDGTRWTHSTTRPTHRSRNGIGLIRRLVKPGIPVYERSLTPEEIQRRIDYYYTPYHTALEKSLGEMYYNYGQVWHINCHSMPSAASKHKNIVRAPMSLFHDEADFVLGDRDGTSCSADFTRAMRDFLKSLGYRVAINHPYRGVELVRRYSAPAIGKHSIQIEINKALYWDEEKIKRSKKYKAFKKDIEKLIGFCADYAAERLIDLAAD